MDVYDLRRLDLNLIVPLHAILVERSVTQAARHVGLTQAAVSKSLHKLRQHFGDELLVRTGRTNVLTPFATTLLPEVEELVRRLGDVLTPFGSFDPSATRRRFSLAASDYLATVMGPDLVETLHRTAPGAALDLVDLGGPVVRDRLDSVDALVLPSGMAVRLHRSVHLLTEQWCLVVDPRLAPEAATWSPVDLAVRGIVATSLNGFVPAQTFLSQMGVETEVHVTASTFGAVPFLVGGTDRVGVVGRRLGLRLAPSAGVVVVDPPWEMPVSHYQLYVDPVRSKDAGTQWFLDLVRSVASAV